MPTVILAAEYLQIGKGPTTLEPPVLGNIQTFIPRTALRSITVKHSNIEGWDVSNQALAVELEDH